MRKLGDSVVELVSYSVLTLVGAGNRLDCLIRIKTENAVVRSEK